MFSVWLNHMLQIESCKGYYVLLICHFGPYLGGRLISDCHEYKQKTDFVGLKQEIKGYLASSCD